LIVNAEPLQVLILRHRRVAVEEPAHEVRVIAA
jgi:hypothetical protein